MTGLPPAPEGWNISRLTEERTQAVAAFGFTERQARFLVEVMIHSGVFVERQYCTFAGIVHGQKTTDFLRKLVERGYARPELLSLRFGDVDFDRRVIRIRPEIAKSKRGRSIPIATTRLRAVLEWLRIDADGVQKDDEAPVFSNRVGEPLRDFREGWEDALTGAHITGLWFHDLRGEYASRLVERGVPLSQVRDLLGHASIVTTERYDRQRFEALAEAAKRLDDGQPFNILSTSADEAADTPPPTDDPSVSNSLSIN